MICSTTVSNINKPYVGIWYVNIGYAWQTYDAYDSTLPRCTPNVSPWLYKTARAAGISEHQQGFSSRAPEEAPNFWRIRSRIWEVTSRRLTPIKISKIISWLMSMLILLFVLFWIQFPFLSTVRKCRLYFSWLKFLLKLFFGQCCVNDICTYLLLPGLERWKTWKEKTLWCTGFGSRKLPPQYAADGVPFCGDRQPAQISTLFQKNGPNAAGRRSSDLERSSTPWACWDWSEESKVVAKCREHHNLIHVWTSKPCRAMNCRQPIHCFPHNENRKGFTDSPAWALDFRFPHRCSRKMTRHG